jgi:hypothetical protein
MAFGTYSKAGGGKVSTPAHHPQLEKVLSRVLENLSTVKYGEISVTLKIHDGRVVSVTHTIIQSTRQVLETERESSVQRRRE